MSLAASTSAALRACFVAMGFFPSAASARSSAALVLAIDPLTAG
ncbi:Unknown protein sequence [Pseudomonas amygdali pv. sesami]|nr:Unknown protein sequence [Pseudomonas amygdali pv. sesami]